MISKNLERLFPGRLGNVYDDAVQCTPSGGGLCLQRYYDEGFRIEAEDYITLRLMSSLRSGAIGKTCDHWITFRSLANKEYELQMDVDDKGGYKVNEKSLLKIVDKHTRKEIEFMQRKLQYQITGNSPACSKVEFERKEFVKSSIIPRTCSVYQIGGGQDC